MNTARDPVLGLRSLGYTEREARKALTGIPDTISGKDARLRAALSANTAR